MFVFVLAALGTALLAGLGTQSAQRGGEARAAAHESGREPAEFGAVPIQADAFRHFLHICFAETGFCTTFTGFRTSNAGVDA